MKRVLFYVQMIKGRKFDHYLEDFEPVSVELKKKGVPHWLVNAIEFKSTRDVFKRYKPTDVFFRLPGLIARQNKFFKKYRCKTHTILHGWPVKSAAHLPVHTDFIYSWGSLSTEFLSNHRVPINKIIETGSPRFDRIYQLRSKKKYNNVPVIGFASVPYHIWRQPNFKREAMTYAKIVYNIDKIAFPKILQRLHPQEQAQPWWGRTYRNLADGRVIFCDPYAEKFLDWLMKIDILVTTQSGTAIEAAALGVPVVTMSFFNRKEYVPTGSKRLSIHVTDPKNLQKALVDAYHRRGKMNPVVRMFNKHLDGSCAKRIVEHVLKC